MRHTRFFDLGHPCWSNGKQFQFLIDGSKLFQIPLNITPKRLYLFMKGRLYATQETESNTCKLSGDFFGVENLFEQFFRVVAPASVSGFRLTQLLFSLDFRS